MILLYFASGPYRSMLKGFAIVLLLFVLGYLLHG